MILTNDNVFVINTKELSYVFHVDKTGLLLHDYYGKKIALKEFDISPIKQKISVSKGTTVIYKEEVNPDLSMDSALLEFSFPHKGDYRVTPLLLKNEKHGYVFDFNYEKYEVVEKPNHEEDELPAPHDIDQELIIHLVDKEAKVRLLLHYLVFEDTNVIARSVSIINEGDKPLEVLKALSMQLDLVNKHYHDVHFTGAWASEMHEMDVELKVGRNVHESLTGFSSHKVNPLFLIKNNETSLEKGDCYIFNLIYSGNHIEEVELNQNGLLRVENGISPFSFNFKLEKGEKFLTPYAVFTYSYQGINKARSDMQKFVNDNVVNKNFKEVVRPVVINNWEGTYFKFNEAKLLKLAKRSKEYGAELFVLDDGWFGDRNDDLHGLGDYDINKKKLPHLLAGLAKKVNKMGLKFGLWFEPESINPNSKLYKEHPEYALQNEGHKASLSRHQLLLDLVNPDVQAYIIENMSKILGEANIEYVKWDMNRHMSDIPAIKHNGEYYHRYILALYKIMKTLTKKFPHILFEGCASGGNRFDLGILTYFPQIWASDNTDAIERKRIQKNYSYGYPLSTLSNHVSSSINHQTLRDTPIDTRFSTAMFGVLGYELLFNELNKFEQDRCRKLIEVYKANREIFQYGEFKELPSNNSHQKWQVLSKDKTKAIIVEFTDLQEINVEESILQTDGLDENHFYKVDVVELDHDIREFGGLVNMLTPIHLNPRGKLVAIAAKHIKMPGEKDHYIVSGSALNGGGLLLNPEWSASGFNENVRVIRDFGTRIYVIDKED